jgi:hypothetical protein
MSPAESAPSAGQLTQTIEAYLALHPAAALLEEGRVLFDMRTARYSVGEQHGRCLLQLWSEERNLVRTVIEVQERAQCLRLLTRRMGAAKPQALELVPTSDRRTPTARDAARRSYQRLLQRALTRAFIGSKVDGMRSAMDLEHSFGPAYIRGWLLRGTAADAVIGVGEAESASIIDGILTLGILWLDYCRQHGDGRRHFGGLKIIVPPGAWRTTAERVAWLNHAAADFQLFTLDERSEELTPLDFRDTGNLESHLVHAFSPAAAIERCQSGIDRLLALVPPDEKNRVEIRPRSATETAVCLCTGWSLPGCVMAWQRTLLPARWRSPSAPAPMRLRLPTKARSFAANCSHGSFSAGTPTALTPTRSFACRPNGGLSPACAPTSANCCPASAVM